MLLSAAAGGRGHRPCASSQGRGSQQSGRQAADDGLIEEVSAAASLPAWRRDDDAGPRALRITKLGLAAIGVDGGAYEDELQQIALFGHLKLAADYCR